MTADRRQRLLRLLEKQPVININDLCLVLGISVRTLRSDLRALSSAKNYIQLINNYVFYSPDSLHTAPYYATWHHAFLMRLRTKVRAKQAIAHWAAELVHDGDRILLDASTTVYYMAPYLSARSGLVVLTNGIEIGRCLAANPSNTVILVAGVIRTDGSAVIGPLYEPARQHHFKTAFVSCQGFSLAAGLTESDEDEANIKHEMVQLADATIALIDSSKFGLVFSAPFARANQVTHIFSDDALESQWAEQVQRTSIVLTRCNEGAEGSSDQR